MPGFDDSWSGVRQDLHVVPLDKHDRTCPGDDSNLEPADLAVLNQTCYVNRLIGLKHVPSACSHRRPPAAFFTPTIACLDNTAIVSVCWTVSTIVSCSERHRPESS